MKTFSLVACFTSLAFVGCATATDAADPIDTDDSAFSVALPNSGFFTLFENASGLESCSAELVTSMTLTGVTLPTWPTTTTLRASLTRSQRACKGQPVAPDETFLGAITLARSELGCGSVLLRGALPDGRSVEVYDHRRAQRRPWCSPPSVNPVIVSIGGALSYALPAVACTGLSQLACESRPLCDAEYTMEYNGREVPQRVFKQCLAMPTRR